MSPIDDTDDQLSIDTNPEPGGRGSRGAGSRGAGSHSSGASRRGQPAERLEGVLEQIYFQNPDSGWTAGLVRSQGDDRKIRVRGRMLGVSVGDVVRLEGRFTMDPQWGRQLEVEGWEIQVPTSEIGIRRYLGSGAVEGIGAGLAGRLVDAFGAETLQVIEEAPERLTEVDGIGPKRARAIREVVSRHRGFREIMVFLQGHGLSAALASRVFKRYGPGAASLLTRDPYRLAEDVVGVGFATADRIAESLGISDQAPERLDAALIHTLERAADDGHLFLPAGTLVAGAAGLLNLDEHLLAERLPMIAAAGRVIVETVEGPAGEPVEAVYRPALYAAERELARGAHRLLVHEGRRLQADWSALRPRIEARLNIAFASEQARAVSAALSDKVLVITGGPGTGKTTIIRAIVEALESQKRSVALAAPTGRAAKRMEEATGHAASTVHRLLEYLPNAGGFQRNEDRPLDCDALVVDEASMLDVILARALLRALPGEARLLLVGDVDQLPSVGPGAVLQQVIASGRVATVRLTEVFRQAARSQIVVCAHQVNRGRPLEPPPSPGVGSGLGELFVVEAEEPERAATLVERLVAERIPERYGLDPFEDIQVLSPGKRGKAGTEQLNRLLQARLNPNGPSVRRGGQELRLGDRVMQIRNNYDKEVFNGDVGRIVGVAAAPSPGDAGGPQGPGHGTGPGASAVDDAGVNRGAGADAPGKRRHILQVSFDGRLVGYASEELDQLLLSYACTVHKSQGSEYPAVVLSLLTEHFVMLERNLLYTAITRARKLFVLVGSRRAIRKAIANEQVRLRNTALAERIRVLTDGS